MKLTINTKRKLKAGLCVAWGCLKSRKGYSKTNRKACSRFCTTHYHIDQKERRPYRYWYDLKKSNALAKGIPFLLTFNEFIEFCDCTGYVDKKGIKKDDYHMDRIKNHIGYQADNIQLLTNVANVRKMHQDKKLRDQYGTTWDEPLIDVSDIVKVKNIDYSEVPF